MTTPRTTSDGSADALPTPWQRLLAMSGIAFAVLFVVGFFMSGGDAPDYMAADQEWRNWAADNESKSRISAFLILIAGFVFLYFAGTIRSVLGSAEATVGGSVQLARVAFAGALTGITGLTMAVVMIAGATAEGADGNPVVTRAVATATVGPFLVAAMGFAALLAAAGLLTLRSGVFARWTGIVALLGAVAFFITFFTLVAGPSEDSLLATAILSASSRSRSGRSLPALRDTARWRPPPATRLRDRPAPSVPDRAETRTVAGSSRHTLGRSRPRRCTCDESAQRPALDQH